MRNIFPLAAILGLIGLALLALTATPSGDQRFDRSPLGARGLELWLKANGVEVVRSSSSPSLIPDHDGISVRILTIREPDFTSQSDGRLKSDVLEEKFYTIPTLIVLPKWKESIVNDGKATRSMLIDLPDVHNAINVIYEMADIALKRDNPGFEILSLPADDDGLHKIALYRPQLIDRKTLPDYCAELVGFPNGALLVSCETDYQLHILSDPDLINNHGLTMADNSAFAVAMANTMLRHADDQRPVYLDTHANIRDSAGTGGEGAAYKRTAADLKRLFDYPLSLIWASSLLVTAIVFWRGSRRFGPPLHEETSDIGHSKASAIDAMTRLLRLSGNDGRMTAQFVHDLLADKAVQVFGQRDAASVERLFSRAARHDNARATQLRSISTLLMEQGPTMGRTELHRNLYLFSELLGSMDLGSG